MDRSATKIRQPIFARLQSLQLKTKFLIGMMGIVIFLGLAMVLFVRIVVYKQLYASLEKRGMFMAHKIAADSIDPILTEKFLVLQMRINDLKKSENDVEYIFVQNARGEVLADTFKGGFPEDLLLLNGNGSGHTGEIQRLATERGVVLDFPSPLLDGTIGELHLGLSEEPVMASVHNVVLLLTWTIVGVLILGGGAAVVLATTITKPIHLLAIAAQSLERGNLDTRVPVRTKDEVGQLATAFNRMAETLMFVDEALSAGERKLRDITSHLGEGLYVMDLNGKITFMNPEAANLLGWSMDELNEVGGHFLVHNRNADGTTLPLKECRMHNVIRTGIRFVSTEEVFTRKDGTVFPIAVVSSPLFEEGEIIGSVTAFRDITQEKELEKDRDQLILAYRDALEHVKTLKGFIPICSSCKKIRNDSGFWSQIEAYISEHSDAKFSHGICPECAQKLYPEYYK
jgi:PAS domain S-box-containing protein